MSVFLHEIIKALTHAEVYGRVPAEAVSSICADSRKAGKNDLFICIRGFVSDGHMYAEKAYEQGTRCFLVEQRLNLPADACQIHVPDTKIAQAEAAAVFYGHPEQALDIIGLTGTKGKTTTALFTQKILCDAGIPTGYIGTNGMTYGRHHIPTVNSTPDSLVLYKTLRDMLNEGIRAVVMEVSSQGLKLSRVHGLRFRVCAFTNLSPDHIGEHEHPDMEDYAACKRRLFTEYPHDLTVYNTDDAAAPYMTTHDTATLIGVTTRNHPHAAWSSPVMQRLVRGGIPGMEYACMHHGKTEKRMNFLPQPGEFNVKNALFAVAIACDGFGVPVESALTSLETATIPGRFETVISEKLPHVLFVIDYAHNGVSMTSMLDLLQGYHPKRLVCLFGSVGDRTKERRRELAEAAGPRAHMCILTSDNPGLEDPMSILKEIDHAFPEGSCPRVLIPDRKEAVAYAVKNALPGDVILLAGKGHETYQLVGKEKLPYSEKDVLAALIDAVQ